MKLLELVKTLHHLLHFRRMMRCHSFVGRDVFDTFFAVLTMVHHYLLAVWCAHVNLNTHTLHGSMIQLLYYHMNWMKMWTLSATETQKHFQIERNTSRKNKFIIFHSLKFSLTSGSVLASLSDDGDS